MPAERGLGFVLLQATMLHLGSSEITPSGRLYHWVHALKHAPHLYALNGVLRPHALHYGHFCPQLMSGLVMLLHKDF